MEAVMANFSNLTGYQIGKMKHALGLDYSRRPYRNYYCCNQPNDEWEDLVQKGFAGKMKGDKEGHVTYYVTYEALKIMYRKNVTKKYYDEL